MPVQENAKVDWIASAPPEHRISIPFFLATPRTQMSSSVPVTSSRNLKQFSPIHVEHENIQNNNIWGVLFIGKGSF